MAPFPKQLVFPSLQRLQLPARSRPEQTQDDSKHSRRNRLGKVDCLAPFPRPCTLFIWVVPYQNSTHQNHPWSCRRQVVGKWLPGLHPPLKVPLSRERTPDLGAALRLRHLGIGLRVGAFLGETKNVPRGRPGPERSPSLLGANKSHPEVYKNFVKLS